MRLSILLVASVLARAQNQASDPASIPLNQAYEALRALHYDDAISLFLRGIEAAPSRASIHKDLAYTYLKIGDNEAARDQFGEAMRLDPADFHVALEYAFLCNETKKPAEARRIFDRIRKTGDAASLPVAEQAFQNIDRPLRDGIERWTRALELAPDNFSAHQDLAQLAEQRDETALAATHYLKAWNLQPDRKSLLLDLGRVWKSEGRAEEAHAALLAASRAGEPRAAEAARELLPSRYPWVYEFRRALDLDPSNVELHRELAYLLLRMDRKPEAEEEFKTITSRSPGDLLSAAQLGFLYLARGDRTAALPLLQRVIDGNDLELANRARAALQLPQIQAPSSRPQAGSAAPPSVEAKTMAERSVKAGYMKDALKYLQIAHESDPVDFDVMLKLAWAYNILHDDEQAIRWFALARQSPDPKIAQEASRGFSSLRAAFAHTRTTAWIFPFYSSRWHDLFSYGQVKTELRLGKLPFRPYLSVRLIGDTRQTISGIAPQYLSESSFIIGAGLATRTWHGLMAWAEAGSAISYLSHGPGAGHMLPDYRGGVALARGWGRLMGSTEPGMFFETNADGVFVSRFGNDVLMYSQNRLGYTFAPVRSLGDFRAQLYWNANLTTDLNRQYWANFYELGPGFRFRWAHMPPSLLFSVNVMRGVQTVNQGNPRGPIFFDLRAGVWYAFTH